jgi:hypothetical protein
VEGIHTAGESKVSERLCLSVSTVREWRDKVLQWKGEVPSTNHFLHLINCGNLNPTAVVHQASEQKRHVSRIYLPALQREAARGRSNGARAFYTQNLMVVWHFSISGRLLPVGSLRQVVKCLSADGLWGAGAGGTDAGAFSNLSS